MGIAAARQRRLETFLKEKEERKARADERNRTAHAREMIKLENKRFRQRRQRFNKPQVRETAGASSLQFWEDGQPALNMHQLFGPSRLGPST